MRDVWSQAYRTPHGFGSRPTRRRLPVALAVALSSARGGLLPSPSARPAAPPQNGPEWPPPASRPGTRTRTFELVRGGGGPGACARSRFYGYEIHSSASQTAFLFEMEGLVTELAYILEIPSWLSAGNSAGRRVDTADMRCKRAGRTLERHPADGRIAEMVW